MTEIKNSEKTFLQKYWFIILLVGAILTLPLYTYISHFYIKIGNKDLSYSPAHWGVLGDFLNPFIALANLVILVYLTIEVKKIEDKRLQQNLDIQVAITISQMRNERVIELTKILDQINQDDVTAATKGMLPDNIVQKVNEIRKSMEHFHKNNHELFLDKDGKDNLLILKGANSFNFDYILRETQSIRDLFAREANVTDELKIWTAEAEKERKIEIRKELQGRFKDLKTGIENSIQSKDTFVWIINKQILEDLRSSNRKTK